MFNRAACLMPSCRASWLKLLFAFFVVGNLTAVLLAARFYGGVIRGTDGQMYYAFVRSAILDHDLDFENEFTSLTPHPDQIYERDLTATGHLANKYPIGTALLLAPWFILAHAATKALNFASGLLGSGELLAPDGYSLLYDRLAGLGVCIYALLGAWATWTLIDPARTRLMPLLLVFALWFGTPAFYYAAVFPLMSHGIGLGLVGVALLWARQSERIANCDESGGFSLIKRVTIASMLTLLVRPMNAPLLLYPAWVILRPMQRFASGQVREIFAWVAGLGVLQLLAWKIVFGEWFLYSYKKEPFFWLSPEITNVLFSSTRGLFFWTPLTLFAVIGLIIGVVRQENQVDENASQTVQPLLLIGFATTLYVSAAWHSWWFGHAFGARQFTEYFPVFAVGLVTLWNAASQYSRKLQLLSLIAGSVSVLWTLNLLVLYAYARLPFQGTLEPRMLIPFWMH